MRSRSGTEDIEEENTNTTLIALENGCFICGNFYSSPGGLRKHISNVHGYDIPARMSGVKRPKDLYYDYIMSSNTGGYDQLHFACPYCWFHCPADELLILYDHTVEQHEPNKYEVEDNMDTSMNNRRRGSGRRSRSRQSRTSSRPSSRLSNRSISSRQSDQSTGSYPSSHKGHISGNKLDYPEHYPGGEPYDLNNRHRLQGRASSDCEDTYSIKEDDKSELAQKLRELRDLFCDLFRDLK